jgi:NTE family protein
VALDDSLAFRGLPEETLERLAGAAATRRFAAGDALDTGGCVYLLVSGTVSISTGVELVGHEHPGSVFGGALGGGDDDGAVYRAADAAEALVWDAPALESLLTGDDELRRQLETRLSLRGRRSELVELLRRTTLFRHVPQPLVRWLVSSSTLAHVAPGVVICREGDAGDSMYLIVSGDVEIRQERVPDTVQQLHRGDHFGEIALVQDAPRSATAVALTPCELLVVGRSEFEALARRAPAFRSSVRLSAALRLEADVADEAEPELVWLLNATDQPVEPLAERIADALRAEVSVAPPKRVAAWEDVGTALDAARAGGAAFALCYSGADLDDALARRLADAAGSVVHVTDDGVAAFPYPRTAPRVHAVVLDGSRVRRGAFALRDDDDAARRLARAIAHRRVGVALGGGAAWGYAHVALLRGLERAGIPVDVVVGVSVGSVVGALYASRGEEGLDRLVRSKRELSAAALAAIATTTAVDVFIRRHVRETTIEDLPLPYAAVAVDARTGREKVFRHGSLADAVRASCSLPGVFGRPLLGGTRYLDAAVRHNVPVRHCAEADADFVIASDVVPTPGESRTMGAGVRAFVLDVLQVNRVADTVRSLYWLASDSSRQQAGLADALFAPELRDFMPWDFHRAESIVEQAEAQLDEWLAATKARYGALAHG